MDGISHNDWRKDTKMTAAKKIHITANILIVSVVVSSFYFVLPRIFNWQPQIYEAQAQHTFDTNASSTLQSTDPVTLSYTAGAGSTVLVVMLAHTQQSRSGGAPTYNGITMTAVSAEITNAQEVGVEMWYLINPPTGAAYTISAPNSTARNIRIYAATFKAASGFFSQIDATSTTNVDDDNPHLALTPSANGAVLIDILADGGADVPTDRSHTLIGNADEGLYVNEAQYQLQAVAASTTLSHTIASDDVAMIAAAFIEVAITTTLGGGSNPSSTIIGPDMGATTTDAFTFQTNSGSDTITSVTTTLSANVTSSIALVEIIDNASTTVYGSVANPASSTFSISLSNLVASTTLQQFFIRITPKSNANLLAPPGSSYTVTSTITAWSGTNTQAGSDSTSTIVTIDNTSPGNVTNASSTAGDGSVKVSWTLPADTDVTSTVVIRGTSTMDGIVPTEGTLYSVGGSVGTSTVACVVASSTSPQVCTDSTVTNGTTYYYKIFPLDIFKNYATGSSTNSVTPAGTLFIQKDYRWWNNASSSSGYATTSNPSTGDDKITSIAIDTSSSAIYVGGYASSSGSTAWRIEKRNLSDGSLVTGFGTNGSTTSNLSTSTDILYSLAIDVSSSAIYAGGYYDVTGASTDYAWRIEKRSTVDGSLVTGFGTNGSTTSNPSTGNDSLKSLAIDVSSSAIYAGGYDNVPTDDEWRIEKRNLSDGSLVTGFGTNGSTTSNPSASLDRIYSLAIDVSSSAIYAGGVDFAAGSPEWRIEKRNLSNGSPITGFGTNGSTTSNAAISDNNGITSIAIDTSSSAIYAGGSQIVPDADYTWHIEKRNLSNGSLVTGFGTNGSTTSNQPGITSGINSLAIDVSSSAIYAGGQYDVTGAATDLGWHIEKRNVSNGSFVAGFGTNGSTTSNPSSVDDQINSLAIDTSSGAIYAGGYYDVTGAATDYGWRIERRSTTDGSTSTILSIGSALAAENNAPTLTSTSTPIRLRMNVMASSTALSASAKAFKLQYSTATSTGWADVQASSSSNTNWWNTSWGKRIKITFSGATTTENEANFPVLVSLNSSRINYGDTNGSSDIRFIDPDNSTQLNYEVEKWDATATSTVWVKANHVSSTQSDFIYMYYNNATATSTASSTAVWDSNFKGVWHLKETATSTGAYITDSTSNASNGTSTGTSYPTPTSTGQIDGVQSFDGNNDYVNVGDKTNLEFGGTSAQYTISAWVKLDTAPVATWYSAIASKYKDTGNEREYLLSIYDTTAQIVLYADDTGANTVFQQRLTDSGISLGQWHHIVATHNVATDVMKIYVDGIEPPATNSGDPITDIFTGTAKFSIGAAEDVGGVPDMFFDGLIDEVRISSSTRSAGWIEAEYKNGADTFSTYGGVEATSSWKFYDEPTASSSFTITSTTLSASNAGETYEEQNPTALNPNALAVGQYGEWDFSLDPANAIATTYYFRMVKSGDTALDEYTNYPSVVVGGVAAGTLQAQDHTLGQIPNQISGLGSGATMNNFVLYRFRLVPAGENMNMNTTTISITSFGGFSASDVSSTLYIDTDDSGTFNAGDTAVGATGTVTFANASGTIDFGGNGWTLSASKNILLVADVANINDGNYLKLSLLSSNVRATGASSQANISSTGSASEATHAVPLRSRGGGGSQTDLDVPSTTLQGGGGNDGGNNSSSTEGGGPPTTTPQGGGGQGGGGDGGSVLGPHQTKFLASILYQFGSLLENFFGFLR